MHEYQLTGREETDNCLNLANKAHNLFFQDPIGNKVEFCKTTIEFLIAIEKKFLKITNQPYLNDALRAYFIKSPEQSSFFINEFRFIRNRLKIVIEQPELMDKERVFLLEHAARFIEFILPFACSVKEEVEHHHKFSYKDVISKEFTFFDPDQASKTNNRYISGFYESAFRTQKALNGLYCIKDKLNLEDPQIKRMFNNYGSFDGFASLIFSRMAFEQFLKYMTTKVPDFFTKIMGIVNLFPNEKENFLKDKNYDHKKISNPSRIEILKREKVIDRLIANELNYANMKGNSNAHNGLSASYSACYTNLLLLSYLEKHYL